MPMETPFDFYFIEMCKRGIYIQRNMTDWDGGLNLEIEGSMIINLSGEAVD